LAIVTQPPALDPSFSIFRAPGIDGLIGYRVVRRCVVVQGDPVCAPEHKSSLADAFTTFCADNGWSILYSAVTADMQAYTKECGYATMEFAGLLMTDAQDDPELDHRGHHLRHHINHARRTGVVVREYLRYTNELMVFTALRALREGGARSVRLGVGPLAALGRIDDCDGATEFLSRSLYNLITLRNADYCLVGR
jgi:lysylphosphatidylglycerol synthetase-like protein (DUF2156 family)